MTTPEKVTPLNFPDHEEDFDVVMLRKGVSELTSTPEDFKRIPVRAATPLAAQMSDAVVAEKGHYPIFTAKPGVLTEPEVMAARRLMEGPLVDRSKL